MRDFKVSFITFGNKTVKQEVSFTTHHTVLPSGEHSSAVRRRTLRKLVALNHGNLLVPQPKEGFVNLSNVKLTANQVELLNLGLNCHVLSPPKPFQKRLELEVLLDNIQELERKGTVVTSGPSLQAELLGESSKRRGSYCSKLLSKELMNAARDLRNNPDITIRRADKYASFVILPTEEYLTRTDHILQDESKFTRITRNPVEDIKRKVNKVIESVNAVTDDIKLPLLSGDYDLGYMYGNVKNHKPGNPLRPIISQIPTPTYSLAKRLATLLTPYVPDRYGVASSFDFLELVKGLDSSKHIASLDVVSSFTNVPIDLSISFILDRVYRDVSTPKLKIPEPALKSLLEICTKEAPFRCPRGRMYVQRDGVVMGSPLGVLFANFFMGTVEEQVFGDIQRPSTYCRYIDDTFICVESESELQVLRQTFEEKSGLHFTMEKITDGALPLLDVLLKVEEDTISTSVYVKSTNAGHCLNGQSECPDRFKETTIAAFVRRALSHCSEWKNVHREIDWVSQKLVDNGYPHHVVSSVVKRTINKWHNQKNNSLQIIPRS
ncbi:uncharacterized protein LOC143030005 [Oratosquilla oratoria]|uniref:uncharacterized protein LOC143030005 n=1 Tax=Oratosquilla oratoria TaxID=337810 RepID=UPI003F775012